MAGKSAVDIRFAAANSYVAALSGGLGTVKSKLILRTDLDTEAKWVGVFGANQGFLPDNAMFYFNVGANVVTIAGPTQTDESVLPQGVPSHWFNITDLTKIRVNGTCDIVIVW